MSTIKRMQYSLELADDPTNHDETREVTVTVTLGDQLRAERQGRKHGVTDAKGMPFHVTALWCWASMSRTGDTSLSFPDFVETVVTVSDPDEADLDPTTRAASGDSA